MKKNRPGMTLVEVVIAIAVFSIMTLAITMTFAAAMKFNTRNMRRDQALSYQMEALERGTAGGVSIVGSTPGTKKLTYTAMGSYSMGTIDVSGKHINRGTIGVDTDIGDKFESSPYDGTTEYIAMKSRFNSSDDANDYEQSVNFQLKKFSVAPLGATKTETAPDANKYGIKFYNMTGDDIVVKLTLTNGDGEFYEGELTEGYRHTLDVFYRSLSGSDVPYDPDSDVYNPCGFYIGYDNVGIAGSVDEPIQVEVFKDGNLMDTKFINKTSLMGTTESGGCLIQYDSAGISISYS